MADQKLTIQILKHFILLIIIINYWIWEIKLKRELGFKKTKTQKCFCSANYKSAKGSKG